LFNLDPFKVWADDQGGDPVPETLKRIRCVGQIPQKELGRYLAACNFVIFLSTNRPVEQACYPIRVGSYVNAERPIATNRANTEISRLVETFGCGVTGDSPQHVAQLLVEVFRDPSRMAAMTENAGRAKAALDYEVLAKGLAEFYEKCAEQSG
jgi:glycosyltransferase involved in cell wall biosynthesis